MRCNIPQPLFRSLNQEVQHDNQINVDIFEEEHNSNFYEEHISNFQLDDSERSSDNEEFNIGVEKENEVNNENINKFYSELNDKVDILAWFLKYLESEEEEREKENNLSLQRASIL